jgi:hypothetical protein
MTISLTAKSTIFSLVLGASIVGGELLLPADGFLLATASAQQDGQSHSGATPHGGASSPHGSSGGAGSWGGPSGGGDLGGGGRSGFGYWGGRHVPDGPTSGEDIGALESGSASSHGYGAEGVLAGNCDEIGKEDLKKARMNGKNLKRLNIAGSYLAPAVTEEKIQKSGSPRRNIANYQEELEKAAPDLTVAGIYLGLVAGIPVTPVVVKKVNTVLCVNTDEKQTGVIAEIAEIQRRSMK